MIVNDFRTSPYITPFFLERTTHTAVLAEPLLYQDRLLGVITIDNAGTGRTFAPEDQQLLSLLADQAAIAIENARLHSAAVRRGEELEALLRATRSVMSGLDLQGILDRILAEAAQISGCSHVKVLLLDKEAGVLRVGALQGTAMSAGDRLPVGMGHSGIVAATGQPLISEDCPNDPRNAYAKRDGELGIVTYLGLPIKSRDEVIGVLTFNTTSPRHYTSDDVAYLTSFADQAAVAIENARLFEQVRTGRERLQILSRRMVEVQEGERRHIARELHDQIGQVLTAVKINLQAMQRLRGKGPLSVAVGDNIGTVERAIQEVRNLSLDLRPSVLDDLGLVPALRSYVDRQAQRAGFVVQFVADPPELRAPSDIETACFRVAQEALTNVVRHAQARRVRAEVRHRGAGLELLVQDDGVGFDLAAARKQASPEASLGLLGMEERVQLMGGQIVMESAPGRGTTIRVRFPLTSPVERRGRRRASG
jgi:signal transduction histidine kinase